MSNITIGIDLGTTNCCVAYYYKGKLKILENSEGGRITESFIYFTDKNASVVGYYAKRMAEAKPEYGVYEIKRLVGRKFDNPQIQNNLQYFSFKIVGDELNDPVIEMDIQKETVKKTPQEICAAILAKLKNDVEAKLGQAVEEAVITVPAYFNVNQREATLAAAKKAGFTVLKLLNEPTAAALSYYLENECETESYSLVYDLGGGTFDVAVLKRNLNNIEILCVDGDTHLGGKDLDNLILDYVCGELKIKYNYDAKKDRRVIRRLCNICEDAKKHLSVPAVEETTIVLTNFVKNHDVIEIPLTRKHFESMADKIFKETLEIVKNCLESSNLLKGDINEVILSGGSTRIPKIQSMLTDFFNGKNLNKFVNPDECVGEGAAIQAALLSKNPRQKMDEIQISDVTSLSIGCSDYVNIMEVLIKRNTRIPAKASTSRGTVYNQQKSMEFAIYEGERLCVKNNKYLGYMRISDLTTAPPGQCEVTITMSIDLNGILKLTATEKYRNNVKELKIDYARGQRSDSEVKNTIKDAKDNKQEDERFRAFATCKDYVLRYCIRAIYNFEHKNLAERYKVEYELCKEIERKAKYMEIQDEAKLMLLKKEVKRRCDTIVQNYFFDFMPVDRSLY